MEATQTTNATTKTATHCEVCNQDIKNMAQHRKTAKHIKNEAAAAAGESTPAAPVSLQERVAELELENKNLRKQLKKIQEAAEKLAALVETENS
jgi:hypothetical protein